ncbi:unnamed protein product [Phytophthora fragariaefolia]|uniref:Unnamed protein product n=1 Tax=Phytophthora fragariaefolia TaxID=1490495 RepID=A0A9W6XAI0_9STRA|nr:unnamed protein product [Phytophthora fragariaefolia]
MIASMFWRSLDWKYQNGLRVDDSSFMATPVVDNGSPVENPADTINGEDPASTALDEPKEAPVATIKRPPPLYWSGSSRILVKKPPRPSAGTQRASAVTEIAGPSSTLTQDSTWNKLEAPRPKHVEGTKEPTKTEQEAKADAINDKPSQTSTPRGQQDPCGVLDCNYTFNSNPEIQVVELKLRKTAQRGILHLLCHIAKFLENVDDRRGQVPGGHERYYIKRSDLLRIEFLQGLMKLGFTLPSDRDDGDGVDMGFGGGMAKPEPKMNDHLYARHPERQSRYRQHIKSDEAKAYIVQLMWVNVGRVRVPT